tara:strand:+ start:20890 stop:21159 length:270 start_codon:yes stop_codon:yes gene_type:complete
MERIVLDDIFDDDGKWAIMPSEIVEALKNAYHELDKQQAKIDQLAEIFSEIQSAQREMQDIANRLNTLQMQPFFTHKLIAELVEPILRD